MKKIFWPAIVLVFLIAGYFIYQSLAKPQKPSLPEVTSSVRDRNLDIDEGAEPIEDPEVVDVESAKKKACAKSNGFKDFRVEDQGTTPPVQLVFFTCNDGTEEAYVLKGDL